MRLRLLVLLLCLLSGSPWAQDQLRAWFTQIEQLATQGQFTAARELAEKAVQQAQALPAEHPDRLQATWLLALACKSSGQLERSEQLFEALLRQRPRDAAYLKGRGEVALTRGRASEAIQWLERAYQARPDPEVLSYQALAYKELGQLARAEELYRRALAGRPSGTPDWAAILEDLAGLHHLMGDFPQAEQEYTDAGLVYLKAFGADSPITARAAGGLALVYSEQGRYPEAESLFLDALTILEETPGPEHLTTLTCLENLGLVYLRLQKYPQARGLFRRVLKGMQQQLGAEHSRTTQTLQNLALATQMAGDLAEAESLYPQALEIQLRTSGPNHLRTARALENLASLQLERQNRAQALELARRAETIWQTLTEHMLTFTSERERLNFLAIHNPYSLFAGVDSAADLARSALRYKGLALDSMVEELRLSQACQDPSVAKRVRELNLAWLQLSLNDQADPAERVRLQTALEQGQARLAREVARLGHTHQALQVEVGQVQACIPEQAVLIEFLRYPVFTRSSQAAPDGYGAVILQRQGPPQWVALGPADSLEGPLKTFLRAVRSRQEANLEAALKQLYSQFWAPLERALPAGTRLVLVSPDGLLDFLSFPSLITPKGSFLGEEYTVLTLASGRDLLARPSRAKVETLVTLGNPNFGRPLEGTPTVATRAPLRLGLTPLPGSQAECRQLAEVVKSVPAQTWLGDQASEAGLRKLHGPRYLHLATHGFFLSERGQNAMDRSGVALAGAQTTLDAWSNGKVPPVDNDGILTAREAGLLDLNGTRLVVLSACDSASGEGVTGQGVMGLRRGLVLAGAENILLTLWPVSDRNTAQFMVDFYAQLEKGQSPPLALAEVQRRWLGRLRSEVGLAAAVQAAGPFVLTFQGPLR